MRDGNGQVRSGALFRRFRRPPHAGFRRRIVREWDPLEPPAADAGGIGRALEHLNFRDVGHAAQSIDRLCQRNCTPGRFCFLGFGFVSIVSRPRNVFEIAGGWSYS
jgi:hypothetical protein